jgi:hypothetical protein
MPSVCATLEKANESRRRAWRELQAIRKMLALVVADLPPPPKPATFEAEGAILRATLARAIAKPWHLLENLESAIEAIRPYLANPELDGNYARLIQDLNRAINRPRPDLKKLQDLA